MPIGTVELEIGAAVAGAVRALPCSPRSASNSGWKRIVDERVDVRAGDDVDRAAVAAVAAARAAARHELLAAERQAAAPAVAGLDVDVDFVDEHGIGIWYWDPVIGRLRLPVRTADCLFDRQDADDAAVRAVVLEPHAAGRSSRRSCRPCRGRRSGRAGTGGRAGAR